MPYANLSLALLGFATEERRVLEAALCAPGGARSGYRLETDPERAALVVADADDPAVVDRVRRGGLLGRTVAVGTGRFPRVARQLPRPLDAEALRSALARLASGVALPEDRPVGAETQRVLESLADFARRASPAVEDVLVVDPDEGRLRSMAEILGRLGFAPHLARRAPEALARLMNTPCSFVFVARDLDGMDGFQLCRAIRRLPDEGRGGVPTLVLLARPKTPSDRVRAAGAGFDHCLDTPVHSVDLQRVVGKREVHKLPFVRTAHSDPAF